MSTLGSIADQALEWLGFTPQAAQTSIALGHYTDIQNAQMDHRMLANMQNLPFSGPHWFEVEEKKEVPEWDA